VLDFLEHAARSTAPQAPFPNNVFNHVIGNNATALSAARRTAESLGYRVLSFGSDNQGEVNAEGRALAERCCALRDGREPVPLPACILSGGEPVVHLADSDRPRKGGRNQQLVLAALEALKTSGMEGMVILSGGTDGEDGPTDAAGAWADQGVWNEARRAGIDPRSYLEVNDSYHFFERLGSLLKTGPTHTNVMDLRVALVG
jgi:hydroxypyruvate reductase